MLKERTRRMNYIELREAQFRMKTIKLRVLKGKLVTLYALNVMDIMMTLLLLSTGKFREANVIMQVALASSSISTIGMKLILPAVVLFFIYKKAKKINQLNFCSILAIEVCIVVYALIDVVHLAYTISTFL